MRRYAWIVGAFLIVVLLVVVELTIITNASGYETKEKVVFAKTQIDKNTVITGDMLELGEVGTAAVHPDALRSIDAVVSKMAGTDIVAGEMLLGTKLTDGEHGVIEAEDKSKRLFSLEFDVHQANGWQLSEDQYVDIIYVPNDFPEHNLSTADEREEGRSNQSNVILGVDGKSNQSEVVILEEGKSKLSNVDTEAKGKNNQLDVSEGIEREEEVNVLEEYEAIEATNVLALVPHGVKVIKNIRIAGLIDEDGKLVDITKSKNAPRYISFEVTEEQAILLAYAKGNGKLELSCIPGK